MASNPPEFWRLRFWGMPSLSGLYYTKNCDFSAIFFGSNKSGPTFVSGV